MIFPGPNAYISPTWYEDLETVPTWNYVSVHVYGQFIPVTDEKEITGILKKMSGFYEGSQPQPWDMGKLPWDFFEKLLKQIVGFRIEISRLEGKWKLSQNHSKERRGKVIRGLESRKDPDSLEIARLMKEKETT